MAQVVWSRLALDRLDAICFALEQESPSGSTRFAARVFQSVERLASFPRSGRIVRELRKPDLREVIVNPYRVIYRVEDSLVYVLTIWHGARGLRLSELA